MQLTSDFECGGGKRLTQLGEHSWRCEAPGDSFGYDKYFCLQVTSGEDEAPAVLHLEVYPDPDAGAAGARYFLAHYPSHVWHCAGADWANWQPLTNRWPDAVAFPADRVELRVPVAPGARLWIASNPVLRYSDLLAWADALPGRDARIEVASLGESTEGRRIPMLRLRGVGGGEGSALPRLLVLAGQHPSEHCGPWACRGIVEYLLSPIAEARELRERFDLAVVPMVNPDGNVRGLSGANAVGINLHEDFADAAAGATPRSTENRLLWDWIGAEFPADALLHFHGYGGWKGWIQPPYDGIYLLGDADTLYADPRRRAIYEAIRARLLFETPAYSGSWRPGLLGRATLEHQLAQRFGTLHAFYEINGTANGAIEQFRRGPQVFGALARALLQDTPPPAVPAK
jgi:hypothetical protein